VDRLRAIFAVFVIIKRGTQARAASPAPGDTTGVRPDSSAPRRCLDGRAAITITTRTRPAGSETRLMHATLLVLATQIAQARRHHPNRGTSAWGAIVSMTCVDLSAVRQEPQAYTGR